MVRLQVSPEQFRHLLEEVGALCDEYLRTLDARPVFPATTGAESERIFRAPWPEQGLGPAALDNLRDVMEYSRPTNPRFFGYVLGSGEPVAAVADLLASVLNQNVTAWRSAPAAVTIERTVVEWLAQAIGCGGFRGSLTSGGSSANLMALAMAREAKTPANETGGPVGIVYASDEVHMSIPKAVALLGIGRANLRLVPTDANFRLRVPDLEEVIAQDLRAGKKPCAIVASAGTVSTGAIDPLHEMAEVARRRGAWFHVDGAYGALAALAVPEEFAGLDLADSISLDPHKWLYQPLDCGCLLYRDSGAAHAAFAHTGDYAKSLREDPVEAFTFFEESLELSRRFRALKIWLSLRFHGMAAFRESIRTDLQLAKRLAGKITSEPALELLAPVSLSAVCFRHRGQRDEADLDRWNTALLGRVIERGRVYLSNATIRGRFALRACILNHRTTERDVDAVVDEVLAATADLRQ